MTPIYTSTARAEVVRAIGVWLSVAGAVALFFLGGQLFVWDDPSWAIVNVILLAIGITLLVRSRARIAALTQANKPYLLSEDGALVLRGRREGSKRLGRMALAALVAFLFLGFAFFFLFSAINCGDRIDGFCGQVGRPSTAFAEAWQAITIAMGAAYVGLVSMRKRFDDETERIDVVVAEGQRSRRHDHPMDGTDRFSWE
jgi:hypothetical protein